jgi:hypothetical protein
MDDTTGGEETTVEEPEYLEGDIQYATSHNAIGKGTSYGQAIVAALVAENAEEDEDAAYVASDYALLVPITINRLVLSSANYVGINTWERTLQTSPNYGYACVENTDFHLYTRVTDRVALPGESDNQRAIDKLMYNEQFDLTELVETHFINSPSTGATDEKVSDDLFRRLNLAYRFYPITYTRGDNLTSESQFITLTGKDENGDFNGIGYFNQVKEGVDKNGKPIGTKIEDSNCEFGPYKLANDACLGRQPIVRVELYRKDMPELVYAVGYLRLEIAKDVVRSVETIDFTARQQLFANCEACGNGNPDEISLTWDQIQAKLNDLKDGQGLSPEAWNNYTIVKNEDGDFAQYVDDDNDPDTDPVLIDRAYGYKLNPDGTYDTSSKFYPWYYVGEFDLVNDSEIQGIHTKVLKWKFSCDDYRNIYFDLQMHDFDPSWINTETGVVKRPITRYVRLHNSDSANPDLFVGVTIPAGTDEKNGGLRFAAGTVGAVKGAYWKDAASNKEGTIDMVINVDLRSKTTNTADESQDVKDGKIYKNIIKNLFGEKIQIDLNLAGIDDAKVKSLAASKFAVAQNYYDGNAIFYFRAPDKDNAKEAKVIRDGAGEGQWVVYGISGNKYTLEVTDKEYFLGKDGKTKFYMDYGSSVSIVKINGKKLASPLKVMTVDTDRYTDEAETTLNANFSKVELLQNEAVKGYTQDMLNYAKHDWESIEKESTTERPYEMQLTAFMSLVADNGYLVYENMKEYEYFIEKSDGSSLYDSDLASCYILPENIECFACQTSVVPVDPETYYTSVCYKPFVDNTKFAVRFYQPVYISNGNKKKTIEDANLANQTPQTINYKDVLYFEDWAGYVPGGDFRNFIKYYGIQVGIDKYAIAETYSTATEEAAENVANLKKTIFGDPTTLPEENTAFTIGDDNYTFTLDKAKVGSDNWTADNYLAIMKQYYDFKSANNTDWDGVKWPKEYQYTKSGVGNENSYSGATSFGGAGDEYVSTYVVYWKGGETAGTAEDKGNITEAEKNAFNWTDANKTGDKIKWYTDELTTAHKPAFTANSYKNSEGKFTQAAVYESPNGTNKNWSVLFKIDPTKVKLTSDGSAIEATDSKKGMYFQYGTDGTPGTAGTNYYAAPTEPTSINYTNTNHELAADELFGVTEPRYVKDFMLADADASSIATYAAQHQAYLIGQKEQSNFLAFYGTPITSEKYITYAQWLTREDKPEGTADGRTLLEKTKFVYSDGGAHDMDGRLLNSDGSKFFDQDGDKTIDGCSANAAKIVYKAPATGYGLYLAALAQYENDVKTIALWYLNLPKSAELKTYVDGVIAHKKYFKWTDGTSALEATHKTTDKADTYLTIPNGSFDKDASNKEILDVVGARFVQRSIFESLMANNSTGDNSYLKRYETALANGNLKKLADAIVDWYKKAQIASGEASADAAAEEYLLSICRTDLGFSGEDNRKVVYKASEIEKLPSILTVAPTDLELDVYDFTACTDDTNGGIKGSFKFQYTNNNGNTNTPFHIYIPLEVTYYYANEAPAAPVKVWAVIEVTASKDNTQTK